MTEPSEPDRMLVRMPSLRALKSFVAAAKYQNFTRAAESLCVTQAAISRQIRELEAALGIELFARSGRAIELTHAGQTLFDATYLSFMNISEAAERIRTDRTTRHELRVCASPVFSSLWLAHRLPDFLQQHGAVEINILTTDDVAAIEAEDKPDVLISMNPTHKDHYESIRLFGERIYPVCTPEYLAAQPAVASLEGLANSTLLEFSSFRRAQITEHIDWNLWFRLAGMPSAIPMTKRHHCCRANDYNVILKMALAHGGVALGWDHLVAPLLENSQLIRPVETEVVLEEKPHYLFYDARIADNENFRCFKNWILSYFP